MYKVEKFKEKEMPIFEYLDFFNISFCMHYFVDHLEDPYTGALLWSTLKKIDEIKEKMEKE